MPPLKQPSSLRDVSMKLLVDYVTNICINGKDNPDELMRSISSMRNDIVAQMPQQLASEFYQRLLSRLSSLNRVSNADLMGISVKVILDQKIIGLDCHSGILKSLRPEDAHRVRRIHHLRILGGLQGHSLDNFHLEHLTLFDYRKFCTDSDLQVIANNCPNLIIVDVGSSPSVTDVGLATLSSCSKLGTLCVRFCQNVTASGVSYFLSVNRSICHIEAWDVDDPIEMMRLGFDFRQVPNWEEDLSVHESLESFTIEEDFSDRHINYLVTKFPNLRSIQIWESSAATMAIIKSLSKLRTIYFRGCPGGRLAKLEELLELIGPQITELDVRHGDDFSTTQRGLDLISRLCENLEFLEFGCSGDYSDSEASLVLPAFKKLEAICFHDGLGGKLELGQMPKLVTLELGDFDVDVTQAESIILDQNNFPSLQSISSNRLRDRADCNRLKKIIRTNNLDLRIH